MTQVERIINLVHDQIRDHYERHAAHPAVVVLTQTQWDTFTRAMEREDYERVRQVMSSRAGSRMMLGVPLMVIEVPSVTR